MHTLLIILIWLGIITLGLPIVITALIFAGFIIVMLVGLILGAIAIIRD